MEAREEFRAINFDITTKIGYAMLTRVINANKAEFNAHFVNLLRNYENEIVRTHLQKDSASYGGKLLKDWTINKLIEIFKEIKNSPTTKKYILRKEGKMNLINKIIDLTIKNEKGNKMTNTKPGGLCEQCIKIERCDKFEELRKNKEWNKYFIRYDELDDEYSEYDEEQIERDEQAEIEEYIHSR